MFALALHPRMFSLGGLAFWSGVIASSLSFEAWAGAAPQNPSTKESASQTNFGTLGSQLLQHAGPLRIHIADGGVAFLSREQPKALLSRGGLSTTPPRMATGTKPGERRTEERPEEESLPWDPAGLMCRVRQSNIERPPVATRLDLWETIANGGKPAGASESTVRDRVAPTGRADRPSVLCRRGPLDGRAHLSVGWATPEDVQWETNFFLALERQTHSALERETNSAAVRSCGAGFQLGFGAGFVAAVRDQMIEQNLSQMGLGPVLAQVVVPSNTVSPDPTGWLADVGTAMAHDFLRSGGQLGQRVSRGSAAESSGR